jgi:4-hydroxy-3-polyprenylbenzoate decarboxylase
MAYSSLRDCVLDLERHGHLRRVEEEVDPHLEMAEIQRRVYAAQGPALLFTRVKGTEFPCLANLYGTQKRTHFLFRHTLVDVKALLDLKRDPMAWTRQPWRQRKLPWTAWHALPKRVNRAAVMECTTSLNSLPKIVAWPKDGGAFITLPQVYTEHPIGPVSGIPIWECIASSYPGASISLEHKSVSITKSTAVSACTIMRPSTEVRNSRFPFLWAGLRLMLWLR